MHLPCLELLLAMLPCNAQRCANEAPSATARAVHALAESILCMYGRSPIVIFYRNVFPEYSVSVDVCTNRGLHIAQISLLQLRKPALQLAELT